MGCVCLLVLAGQGWATREAHLAAVASQETEVLQVARSTAAALEQLLAVARRSTASLARTRGARLLTPEGCREEMGPLEDAFPFFANLMVLDAEGTLVCSALGLPPEPVSAQGRHWFTTLSRTRDFSVGRPTMGPVSDTWVVAMGSPVLAADGTLLGAVAGSVELFRLEEILVGREAGPSTLVTITTDDGVVVARSAEAESWVGRPLPSGTVEVERRGERLLVTRAQDASGLARVWGRVDLPWIAWRVYAGVPASRIRGLSRADLVRHGVVTLVLVGLTLFLALLLLSGGGPSTTAPSTPMDPDLTP